MRVGRRECAVAAEAVRLSVEAHKHGAWRQANVEHGRRGHATGGGVAGVACAEAMRSRRREAERSQRIGRLRVGGKHGQRGHATAGGGISAAGVPYTEAVCSQRRVVKWS